VSASERRIAALEVELGAARGEISQLRHLLKLQMTTGETLEVEAIARPDGTPFVVFRWDNLAAQLPASEAREFIMGMFRVCEWAETDAGVIRELRAHDADDQMIGYTMLLLRRARGDETDRSGITLMPAGKVPDEVRDAAES
jgi:hypothetical protein